MAKIKIMSARSWVEAPRFKGYPDFIRELASGLNLKIVEFDVRSGCFFERVNYKVEGDPDAVQKFVQVMKSSG